MIAGATLTANPRKTSAKGMWALCPSQKKGMCAKTGRLEVKGQRMKI